LKNTANSLAKTHDVSQKTVRIAGQFADAGDALRPANLNQPALSRPTRLAIRIGNRKKGLTLKGEFCRILTSAGPFNRKAPHGVLSVTRFASVETGHLFWTEQEGEAENHS
jgi:hypothetical protein